MAVTQILWAAGADFVVEADDDKRYGIDLATFSVARWMEPFRFAAAPNRALVSEHKWHGDRTTVVGVERITDYPDKTAPLWPADGSPSVLLTHEEAAMLAAVAQRNL